MNLEPQIRLYCGNFPFDRIKLCELHQINLAAIERGVCFIFATWSGSSVVSFQCLCDALMRAPNASFPIYIVNTDEIDYDSFKKTFGYSLNGNGEAMWIKNGKILAFDIGYTNKEEGVLQNSAVLPGRINALSEPDSSTDNV